MAASFELKKPTNAEPRQTDVEITTLAAGFMRKVLVSKATGSVMCTAFDGGGGKMAFFIQGSGEDGEAQTDGYPYDAGSHDVYDLEGGGNPTRGAITGEAWTFLIAGVDANATFHFQSSLHE